jgi:hypothetical protein
MGNPTVKDARRPFAVGVDPKGGPRRFVITVEHDLGTDIKHSFYLDDSDLKHTHQTWTPVSLKYTGKSGRSKTTLVFKPSVLKRGKATKDDDTIGTGNLILCTADDALTCLLAGTTMPDPMVAVSVPLEQVPPAMLPDPCG